MKPKFIDGCKERGHDPKVADKFGKIGKHLPLMPLINHTLPAIR